MPAMETIGQIPGSCEELFGLRGTGKSELVGASQERLGRIFFPDLSLKKTRNGEVCGSHVGWIFTRPWTLPVSPALPGYGEDGVHSREAADTQKTEDWKKLMGENDRKESWGRGV